MSEANVHADLGIGRHRIDLCKVYAKHLDICGIILVSGRGRDRVMTLKNAVGDLALESERAKASPT